MCMQHSNLVQCRYLLSYKNYSIYLKNFVKPKYPKIWIFCSDVWCRFKQQKPKNIVCTYSKDQTLSSRHAILVCDIPHMDHLGEKLSTGYYLCCKSHKIIARHAPQYPQFVSPPCYNCGITKRKVNNMTLKTLHPTVTFVSTWFCNICQIETGQDEAGSVWCECD